MKSFELPNNTEGESQKEVFRSEFQSQWENKEIEMFGEKVHFIDISPAQEQLASPIPVLFVPGWGRTANSYQDLLYELYAKGRRVVSVEYPRWSKEGEEGEGLPTQQQKANTLVEFLCALEIDSADVLTHSGGGADAILAAGKDTACFRNFVLVDSGGYDSMSFTELLLNRSKIFTPSKEGTRLAKSRRESLAANPDRDPNEDYSGAYYPTTQEEQEAKQRKRDAAKDVLRSARNPKRILSEAVESIQVLIPDRLHALKQAGHEIALVHGVNDHVIPLEDLNENISADMVTGVYTVRGDHSDMSLYPESYGVVATSALEALEQKSLADAIEESGETK